MAKKTKDIKLPKSKAPVPTPRPSEPLVAPKGVEVSIGGKVRLFDIDDPKLPKWIDDAKLSSGGYPHDKKLDDDTALKTLETLQIELVKLLEWMAATKARVAVVFEGRDAAGKGGTIGAVRQYMNPRVARNVALPKPSDVERGQWYFQRYVAHMPTFGEFVTFDRSWYNRAGVEPVMGFCTPEQHEAFLNEAPDFEKMLVSDGIFLLQVLARHRPRNPIEALPRPPPFATAPLEILPDGRRRHRQMGRLHQGA